jgi:hypothetical protein
MPGVNAIKTPEEVCYRCANGNQVANVEMGDKRRKEVNNGTK